jgi:hypothetical protein
MSESKLVELPVSLHCPICGEELPKEPKKYKQNKHHPNEYFFKCKCGGSLFLSLDDHVDYNQDYIEIGVGW